MYSAIKSVKWFLNNGLQGLSDSEKSKRYAFNVILLIGIATALSYAAFYAIYDAEGLRAGWLGSLICAAILIITPTIASYSLRLALCVSGAMGISVFMFMTYHMGTATGVYLFLFAFIVAVFIVNGRDNLLDTVLTWIAATVAMILSVLYFQEPSGAARVDAEFQQIVLVGVVIGLSAIQAAGVLVLSTRVARAEAALAAEHERSEALLRNLLPDVIATRLKASPGEVIADDLSDVTILFADIVGFTQRASSTTPKDLIEFLNDVFTGFDELTEKYGMEKIKTIGDAYMVGAGILGPRKDHAQTAANMALEILDLMDRRREQTGEHVGLRIGLHSGPAISGVIGTKKVFFDIWGDTVNTASRMESGGAEGRIQVSRATKERLGAAYVFQDKPIYNVKGKGPMQTYWLMSRAR